MRKIIFITFAIVLLITLILLAYWSYQYFQGTSATTTQVEDDKSTTSGFNLSELPSLTATSTADNLFNIEALIKVSDEEILDFWPGNANGSFYFINLSGQIGLINGGKVEMLTSQIIDGINEVKISPDDKKILVHFNYPQSAFSIYDILEKNWRPLPSDTITAAWHPTDSSKIAYFDGSRLKILDLSSAKAVTIMSIHLVDVVMNWPSADTVDFADRLTTETERTIWKINLTQKTIQQTTTKRMLAINDLVTVAAKCASRTDREQVYCAVPKQIPNGLNFPDDYWKRKYYSDDVLYVIDETQTTLLYSNLGVLFDAIAPKILGDRFYFVNRYDNKLYGLYIGL